MTTEPIVGQQYRITNTSGHGFLLGEIVIPLYKREEDSKDFEWECTNRTFQQSLGKHQLEPIEPLTLSTIHTTF